MSVVITEQYNVMVNSEELIGTTEYLTLYTRRRINRCRYNRVRLYNLQDRYCLNIHFFWDVTLCRLMYTSRRLEKIVVPSPLGSSCYS
jgi:hypothetical protein